MPGVDLTAKRAELSLLDYAFSTPTHRSQIVQFLLDREVSYGPSWELRILDGDSVDIFEVYELMFQRGPEIVDASTWCAKVMEKHSHSDYLNELLSLFSSTYPGRKFAEINRDLKNLLLSI